MQPKSDNAALGLNMRDRVEILSNLVSGRTDDINIELMQMLMEPFYPCFQRFCHDVLGETEPIFQVDALYHEQRMTFITSYEDGSVKDYTYEERDPLFPEEI